MQIESSTISWQEEFRDSFKNLSELESFLEKKIQKTNYPIFIPRLFAQKIKDLGPDSSLWKQFIPRLEENNPEGLLDPIGDEIHAKENGIIHRYKNRVLFNPTTKCPINCRYCFRKNELFEQKEFLKANLSKLADYLIENPQIEEVILTGGDPLILSDSKIENILKILSLIPSIKYIRFHTRTPIILPSRLTKSLSKIFEEFSTKFETITLAIHVNHCEELDSNLFENLKSFKNINLISQTVLLKGINDSIIELVKLFKKLNQFRIRPYYLHHPDKVKGAMHFYLPIKEGRKIYGQLRDELPGWLIPHYVVDSAQGIGKNLAYNSESLDYSGQLMDRFNQIHFIDLK